MTEQDYLNWVTALILGEPAPVLTDDELLERVRQIIAVPEELESCAA